MRLSEILQPDCIKVPVVATDKQDAIFELAEVLCEKRGIEAVDDLKQAIWDREVTRTTGIGHGIAIPHGKTRHCPSLCMALGKPQQPIEFGAIDNKPVRLIILLASPLDETGPHIQALARISQLLTPPEIRQAIMDAQSAEAVYQLICEHEAERQNA